MKKSGLYANINAKRKRIVGGHADGPCRGDRALTWAD